MPTTTVQVRDDGVIRIPPEMMEKYGLIPNQPIEIMEEEEGLKIMGIKKDPYEEFVELLEEGLKGIEWKEIEKGRKDRCF
ncbi:MAG: AbrB/MazE/SpoVT family DNA-binding domain-containing protein [bacterium]|nr:AbrB/MazE/SpoVT family DNA-binding domain-containing protein [bacterium]